MGDIGPMRRRIEVLPMTKPVLPAPATPTRTPAPTPIIEPLSVPVKESAA